MVLSLINSLVGRPPPFPP